MLLPLPKNSAKVDFAFGDGVASKLSGVRKMLCVPDDKLSKTFARYVACARRAAPDARQTTKPCTLNDVDAHLWLTDSPARIADHRAKRITELLPWN